MEGAPPTGTDALLAPPLARSNFDPADVRKELDNKPRQS